MKSHFQFNEAVFETNAAYCKVASYNVWRSTFLRVSIIDRFNFTFDLDISTLNKKIKTVNFWYNGNSVSSNSKKNSLVFKKAQFREF